MLPDIFRRQENLDLFDPFKSLMSEFDRNFLGSGLMAGFGKMMKTDIHEEDGQYQFSIELPGFSKDQIEISLEDGELLVKADKVDTREDKDKKGQIIHQERYSGSVSRSFYVGKGVSQDDIKAKYEDGILKITVPKEKEPEPPERKLIGIE